MLARWRDDELEGEELAAVEAWAAARPEWVAAREETRRWKAWLAASLPAAEEPPYPDFFDSRIARAIRVPQPGPETAARTHRLGWRRLLMPSAACAGMALAFLVGQRSRPTTSDPEFDFASAPRAIPVGPVVYTPDKGVKAEWIESKAASATVIVLHGMEAIPDSTDFSRTAAIDTPRAIDATAASDPAPASTPAP